MKKVLLLFAIMMMAVTSAFAEWTKPALPQGLSIENADGNDVYFVNVETGKFFNGMKTIHDWNTTGGVDVYGLIIEFYDYGSLYNGNDRNRMIFRNSITELHVDHLSTSAGGTWGDTEDGGFDFKVNGSYVRICTRSNSRGYTDSGTRFWGVIPSQHPSHVYPNANPAVAGNFCDWIIITPETYAVYQPKVLRYYTAVELGDALANIKNNYPEIKVSAEQAVYDNAQSTTEQLRAAIMSLTAKLKRPTVFYKVDPSLELTFSATSLDGVTAVITDHDGKKTWGVFTGNDGQDINANYTRVYDWSSKSEYSRVIFYAVDDQPDNVYYIKFVKPNGEWYNPRGDWHGNQGCMNVTGDGTGLFVGGITDKNGQDVANGALWEVTKTAEGYTLRNVGKGVYAVPGIGVVSNQEDAYVSLYSGFTTCRPEFEGEYTHYIANNTVDGTDFWNIERPNGGNGPLLNNSAFEYWGGDATPRENASFNYYQIISDLPAGKYILSAEMYNSSNGEDGNHTPNGNAGLYIKCGEAEKFVGVTEDGTTLKKYSTAEIVVNEGDVVTVGIKSKGYMSARWFVADNFTLTRSDNFLTLNTAGFATFSSRYNVNISGAEAYKASVEGETITLTKLEGYIPAGTGVLLFNEDPEATVTLSLATSGDAADVTSNALKATTKADGTLASFETNTWALGEGSQFLNYTGTAYIHNRAYIVHTKPAGVRAMRIVFAEDETTAIDNAVIKTSASEGKFLENGKIVIVKNGVKYNVVGLRIK